MKKLTAALLTLTAIGVAVRVGKNNARSIDAFQILKEIDFNHYELLR